MNPLPDKMSDLLELAIKDAQSLDPNVYILHMDMWHHPDLDTNTCYVCLAGAVMAKELGDKPSQSIIPSDHTTVVTEKLTAINKLRVGDVYTAAVLLNCSKQKLQKIGELQFNNDSFEKACNHAKRFSHKPWHDNWSAHLNLVKVLREHNL
mgnify:FL=1